MAFWLLKSEPNCFSFDDLEAAPDRSTGWDGVRNFQARNFLRDSIQVGDGVLFYHSSVEPIGIAGFAEITRAGHPDPTAFDPRADHYDPKSDPDQPTWFQVTVRAVAKIDPPLTLAELKKVDALAGMELLRKGSRLSVQPVTPREWEIVSELAAPRVQAPVAAKTKPKPKTKTASRKKAT
ncbi:MAG: EVE domain-containing protein [Isosphaeraceae bacterium]|nr:EVE domain-containing protein [Isosphaeraceae bacterium]